MERDKFANVLKDSIYSNASLRDMLLKLAQFSTEFTILDCTNDQEDLTRMLADYTSNLHYFLEKCLQSNSTTEEITELKWNPDSDIDLVTFRLDS